jgi:hypothetical protein
MKNKIQQAGFVMYLIAIITIVSMSLASCSNGGYSACAAYQCVEITD